MGNLFSSSFMESKHFSEVSELPIVPLGMKIFFSVPSVKMSNFAKWTSGYGSSDNFGRMIERVGR